MRGYFAIFKIRMKTLFQYRAAAFAGICTQLFWGLVFVMIFKAFYADSHVKEPLSLSQTITYIWVGQALLQLLPWKVDKEIGAQIRSGNIAYELIRPLDLYGLWYCRSIALLLAPTLLRALPIFVLGGLFLGLEAPISWSACLAFIAAAFLACFLSAAITTLVIVTLFWTLSGEGIERLLPHVTVVLSGNLVPLPLFPNWMQPFLSLQPFRGIIDIPCRLYMGVIPANEAPYYLGFQLVWIFIFVLLGKWLLHKATQQFVIQGG
jgi:ABC-2 type transport system permease protein